MQLSNEQPMARISHSWLRRQCHSSRILESRNLVIFGAFVKLNEIVSLKLPAAIRSMLETFLQALTTTEGELRMRLNEQRSFNMVIYYFHLICFKAIGVQEDAKHRVLRWSKFEQTWTVRSWRIDENCSIQKHFTKKTAKRSMNSPIEKQFTNFERVISWWSARSSRWSSRS